MILDTDTISLIAAMWGIANYLYAVFNPQARAERVRK